MLTRRHILTVLALMAALTALPAIAQTKIKVVATISILGDLVKNVGGDRVDVATLVGPGADAHVYSPTPADVNKLTDAKLVIVNGLGLEGWMARLVKASGTKAPLLTATKGVKPRKMEDEHHAGRVVSDPHAWQSIANAKIYVANIRDGLTKADPAGKQAYEANATAYAAKLDELEKDVKAAISTIPADRRRIITTHDAFGYFGDAYGMEFISPEGVSTESEASARDVAKIITQIKKQKIPAVFMENISDPRLMEQIAKESGAKIGGTLFSDALSDEKGPAPTYIDMMQNNIARFKAALAN
ncbi:MAG: zinc/manganese transport system substrate-binding protein [Hyphomicrobiales bacterium]